MGHLLDFLCEVLGHDATFLLLLFVFAWRREEGRVSGGGPQDSHC